jgi:hypothetical protein
MRLSRYFKCSSPRYLKILVSHLRAPLHVNIQLKSQRSALWGKVPGPATLMDIYVQYQSIDVVEACGFAVSPGFEQQFALAGGCVLCQRMEFHSCASMWFAWFAFLVRQRAQCALQFARRPRKMHVCLLFLPSLSPHLPFGIGTGLVSRTAW